MDTSMDLQEISVDPVELEQILNSDFGLEGEDADLVLGLLGSKDFAVAAVAENEPSQVTRATGKEIQETMKDDCHFLCTCTNFYPLDKKAFEKYGEEHLVELFLNDVNQEHAKHGVRPLIPALLSNAHQQAKERKGNAKACFRIWKPVLPPKTKSVKKATWQGTQFDEVTGNEGIVLEALESAVRTLREKAMEKVKAIKVASANAEVVNVESPTQKRQRPQVGMSNNDAPRLSVVSPSTTIESSMSVPVRATSSNEPPPPPPLNIAVDLDEDPDGLFAKAKDIIVKEFLKRYEEDGFQDRLDRLNADFLEQNGTDYKEWAKQLYKILRENPNDERAKRCNRDRKGCLTLLYDMVNAWDDWVKKDGRPSHYFERAMCQVFEFRRFQRILVVALVMDRAQCQYLMRDLSLPANTAPCGMPWYSSWHFRTDTAFARDHGDLMIEFKAYVDDYQGYLGSGGSTMNKRLFRLLFLEPLGLQNDAYLRELSMPAQRPEDADIMLS